MTEKRVREDITSSTGSDHCLLTLGRWDRGFESHSRHGCLVCVPVYSVFVLSCV
jgi:hypothetical protein